MLGKDYDATACSIPEEKLLKLRNEFEYWYPMDLRVSAKDLIRNHLTMSLYNHAAIWKENKEKRMVRSYFCNGYLMLNNKKMSKSTGNFLTLKQCMDKFGTDATRIALADAGDTLDDANFDESVANAAILRLFNFEEWLAKHLPKNVDFAAPGEHDMWDRIMMNEVSRITQQVTQAYDEMKYKVVLKHAFIEMLSLKETYLTGKGAKGANPNVLFHFCETMLVLMNPLTPHYCQHLWDKYLVPAIKTCQNVHKEPAELLINQGWPKVDESALNPTMSNIMKYLHEVKHNIRIAQGKAASGGKKAKKGPVVEAAVKENCALIVGKEFPGFQRQVLEILSTFEFVDGKP